MAINKEGVGLLVSAGLNVAQAGHNAQLRARGTLLETELVEARQDLADSRQQATEFRIQRDEFKATGARLSSELTEARRALSSALQRAEVAEGRLLALESEPEDGEPTEDV